MLCGAVECGGCYVECVSYKGCRFAFQSGGLCLCLLFTLFMCLFV